MSDDTARIQAAIVASRTGPTRFIVNEVLRVRDLDFSGANIEFYQCEFISVEKDCRFTSDGIRKPLRLHFDSCIFHGGVEVDNDPLSPSQLRNYP